MNFWKKILILTKIVQTKIFNELVAESYVEFQNLGKWINPDNLIYKYKAEGRSPEYFRNYQNPIKLFKDLRDVDINTKEVIKNQINFKPNLGEIKKGISKSRSKDQISAIQNVQICFHLREKIIDFFRDNFFSLWS